MKDIVKYDNYFNSINFNGLKSNELNVIMALCAKMKDKESEYVKFTYNELKEAMFVKHITDEELKKIIKSASNKLKDVNGEIVLPDGREVDFNLFPTRINDPNERTFTIRVNNDVSFILNDLTKNFTLFELNEFVNLNSKYSKHLYRLLKQFRTTGVVKLSIDDLRYHLCIKESYSTKRIGQEILKTSIEELKLYFKDLKIEVKKAKKRGSPVTGYIFTFEAEQIKKKTTPKEETKAEPQEQNYSSWTEQTKAQMNTAKQTHTSKPLNHRFNAFPQRSYSKEDYKNIEKKLLRRN